MDVKTIELKKTILEDNDRDADVLREQLAQQKTAPAEACPTESTSDTMPLSEA